MPGCIPKLRHNEQHPEKRIPAKKLHKHSKKQIKNKPAQIKRN